MEIIVEKPNLLSPGCGTWQQVMKSAIRDSDTLFATLGLQQNALLQVFEGDQIGQGGSLAIQEAQKQFPVFVPSPFLSRIRPGDPADPLLLQVAPTQLESPAHQPPGFSKDPLAEYSNNGPTENTAVIQKYSGRALLITTGACGIHCRYCFRRHFPYQDLPKQRSDWSDWLNPIQADPSINEVILSGGDPLILTDPSLKILTDGLRAIDHVKWLRVHSRMPVVIPQRITPDLIPSLVGFESTMVVIHSNHPQEIDSQVAAAVSRLRDAGIQVMNQTVLMRNINDCPDVLESLSRRLIQIGVIPYYLHQLDKVSGAAHFHVPIQRGRELVKEIRARLPGYAVPRYAQEEPGLPNKTILE